METSAALTKGREGREIAEIGLLAEAGAVAFSDGPRSVANAQTMRRALTYARDFGALVIQATTTSSLAIGVPASALIAVKAVVVIVVILLYSQQVRDFFQKITARTVQEEKS